MLSATSVRTAADSLQQISSATSGERGRRAAVVSLVLRSIELTLCGSPAAFLRLRAEQEAATITAPVERAILKRLLLLGEEPGSGGEPGRLVDSLVEFSYQLESTRRYAEAEAVLLLARSVAPEDAGLCLHSGRVARQQGERERALDLYRAARDLDAGGGEIARLAAIGEAVVSPDAERELGRVLRAARRAGDQEAAAVALEERARLRRARGARRAAARDLCCAAARFSDPVDRARVAHQLADLCLAGNDPLAAREALLLALAVGDPTQRDHARGRLHAVSRDLGDQVGTRRWRSSAPPALVSLSARAVTPVVRSAAAEIARWRERLAGDAPTPDASSSCG